MTITPVEVPVAPKRTRKSKEEGDVAGQIITLPQLKIQDLVLRVIGDSPLIMHKWSEKAIRAIVDKQMKKAKQAKEAKDPWSDFCHSMHWITPMPTNRKVEIEDIVKAKFGFPAIAFKAAAVDACSHVDGITKVLARGAFHIDQEMVEIQHPEPPSMREDMVRIAMGTADVRYRGEFKEWSAIIPVRYNANVLSADQIVNLFEIAGFAIGIGEWRPQKDGQNGRFHVAKEGE